MGFITGGISKCIFGHKSMDIRRCSFPKPMDRAQANKRDIENGNSNCVRNTSAKGLMHSSVEAMFRTVLIIRM
jgi:hypothetical protein